MMKSNLKNKNIVSKLIISTVKHCNQTFFFFLLLQSSHMSMIDALMMAYTVEMISIEKVVASVKRFSTFRASKELPFDLEDAMVFWINKV